MKNKIFEILREVYLHVGVNDEFFDLASDKIYAELIADAGNTAQKCGLLPSELLKQRDELKEALAEMIWQFGYRSTYEGRESLHTGGLSALESAFGALGLSDPIALLDFEAAIKNTEKK